MNTRWKLSHLPGQPSKRAGSPPYEQALSTAALQGGPVSREISCDHSSQADIIFDSKF